MNRSIATFVSDSLDEAPMTAFHWRVIALISAGAVQSGTPVLLSSGAAPPAVVDIIINLAPDLPNCLSQTRRVAEIIDGDDARRRAGRARFKAYRDLGIQPASHNIRGD